MRMRKVMAIMMATALTATTVLTGCGGGKSAGKDKTLSVFVFANDNESKIYKEMMEKYVESNENIDDIDLQITTQEDYATTLTGMMTANDLPDVFYVGPESVKDFVENGYIANLEELLTAQGISTDNLAVEEAMNSYRYDGTTTGQGSLYALPKDASVFAYAYNKDLFDEAGLEYPDPDNPYTYDEFVEVCQKLTKDKDGDGEIDQWGCGFANAFMMYQFIWSNGASFLSDDYKTITIDTDEFKDAFQKYVDLTLEYKVTPTVEQDASLGVYQRWLAGQEAFYACGTWDVAAFMDDETFPYEWDLCGYPTLSSGKSATWLGTVGICVNAKSDKLEEAAKLVSYISMDEEGQRQLSGIGTGESIQLPNIATLSESEFPQAIADGTLPYPSNIDVLYNYLDGTDKYEGRFMESTYTPNSEWMDLFLEGVDNVKNGSMTVDEYIAQVQPQMQASLDQAWANAK